MKYTMLLNNQWITEELKEEIKNTLRQNEPKHKNLKPMDTAK